MIAGIILGTLFVALLSIFLSGICIIDNNSKDAKICFIVGLICLLLVPVEFYIDNKYYRPKRIQEEKQKFYNKYKNGPIKITTNSIGCVKYNYYNDLFWICPNKNINQIEEQIGKQIVQTPVINSN